MCKKGKEMKAYRLKISLQGAEPPVWRRIDVPAGIKFGRLRVVIGEAMEWFDRYLCAFRFEREKLIVTHADRRGRAFVGMCSPDVEYEKADTWSVAIDDLLQEGATF